MAYRGTPSSLIAAAHALRARVGHLALVVTLATIIAPAPARAGEGRARPSGVARESAGFEAVLAQHGAWVPTARRGRAWRPTGVGDDWRPYLRGSWTYTEDGWFWVTDEPWGFATYHYGRWFFDAVYGWVWLPGRTWAPAWVAWRWDAEVVGWAPLPPEGAPALASWTFVPARHFVGERAEEKALPAARVPALWVRTRPRGPTSPAAAAQRVAPGARRG
jgi:hypothetical protein